MAQGQSLRCPQLQDLLQATWVGKTVILDGDPAGLLHAVKYFSKMFALSFGIYVVVSRYKLYERESEWRELVTTSVKLLIVVAIGIELGNSTERGQCPLWVKKKRTFAIQTGISALPSKADMCDATRDVR